MPARDGGSECPPLKQEVQCNTRTCDCKVTNYSEWGECDVKCGGGLQWKTREVILSPVRDGAVCPELNLSRPCNEMPCEVEGIPFGGVRDGETELVATKISGVTAVLLPDAPFDNLEARDESTWCYQKPATLAPYSYGALAIRGAFPNIRASIWWVAR